MTTSPSLRAALAFECLEERAVPANNLTVQPVSFDDSAFVRVQQNGPAVTIRTTAPDAGVSLKTIQDALADPDVRTVVVTTDVANGQGSTNGNQAGNITWDGSVVGNLDFTGFGTGKTLTFRTIDEGAAVGNITLTSVTFTNGGGTAELSVGFDSSDPGGNILFQSAGAFNPTVTFSTGVRDLTVVAGTGTFTYAGGGFFGQTNVSGGVTISAGPVTLANFGGITAEGAIAVTAGGAVSFDPGAGLTAGGDLTVTAGGSVTAGNSPLSAGGKLSVSGTTVTTANTGVTAGAGLAITGTAAVSLDGGMYDVAGDFTLTGGTVDVTNLALPDLGAVTLAGTAVSLENVNLTGDGAVAVTGTGITLNNVGLEGDTLTVTGPMTLAPGSTADLRSAAALSAAGAVNGAATLSLTAGGTVTLGPVGATTGLTAFNLIAGRLNLGTTNLNATSVTVGAPGQPVEAILGLTGIINGSVTVESTGNLAPGGLGTVGTTTVIGNVNLAGDLAVDFGPTGGADQLAVTGSVNIGPTSLLGGGLGTGRLNSATATIIDSTGGVTGQFQNAAVGVPVLAGTDVITVVTYSPDVVVVPYTPPGGAGPTATGIDPTDATGFKATLTGGGTVVAGSDWLGRPFLVARDTTPASKLTITTTANGSDDLMTFSAGVLVSGPLAALSAPKVSIGEQFRASGAVLVASFRDLLGTGAGGTLEFGGAPGQLTSVTARNLLGSVRIGSTLNVLRVTQVLGSQVGVPDVADSAVIAPAVGSVTAGSATINVETPGRLKALKVVGSYTGSITADSVGAFSVGGGTADLDVNRGISAITGVGANGLELSVSASSVGAVKVGGELSGDGDPATLDWAVANGITSLAAGAVADLNLSAKFLGATAVKGNLTAGLAGSIDDSTFILTGDDGTAGKFGLKSLVAQGNVTDSRFDVKTGNVGAVSVGRFHESQFWVGYTPAASGDFLAGSVANGGKLASFKTTAVALLEPHPLQYAFRASQVVSASIGTVTLSGLQTANAGTAFGIKVRNGGAVVKVMNADVTPAALPRNTPLIADNSAPYTSLAQDFFFIDV
ncbi:MAG TPA: hypothetical protein VM597_40645 [Gemmataceae bacterium]|nr:hypothetical protein [Gemmataceae bacterium]